MLSTNEVIYKRGYLQTKVYTNEATCIGRKVRPWWTLYEMPRSHYYSYTPFRLLLLYSFAPPIFVCSSHIRLLHSWYSCRFPATTFTNFKYWIVISFSGMVLRYWMADLPWTKQIMTARL
ncbi:hypothetical protein J3E68DRAFT_355471 [Trichoderma sp. SZMC 28012]